MMNLAFLLSVQIVSLTSLQCLFNCCRLIVCQNNFSGCVFRTSRFCQSLITFFKLHLISVHQFAINANYEELVLISRKYIEFKGKIFWVYLNNRFLIHFMYNIKLEIIWCVFFQCKTYCKLDFTFLISNHFSKLKHLIRY